MRCPWLSTLAVLTVAALGAPAPAAAQRAVAPAGRVAPGDKTRGEEEQIRKREEWFIQSRGLREVARPDLLRADAVREAAAQRALRADELQEAGQVWQPVGPATMTMLSWAMGPVAGRVVSMAVHPNDENVVYLGAASGGLWKTTDGGQAWTSIFDEGGTMSMGAVVLDPANPDVVWVGTGERQSSCANYFGLGLFRSPDGGATFEARNGSGSAALELSYVNSIAVHPASANTLLVSGEAFCLPDGTRVGGGVFKTTDGGLGWTRVRGGTGSDVIYDPTNPSIVYLAASGEGIFKSTDGGDTWAPTPLVKPAITASTRIRLAMAASDPQVLYTLGGSSGVGRLYKTTNGATSWALMNGSACDGQCTYNLHLDIDPTDPAHILLGTIRPWVSSDSGVTRTALTDTWGSGQTVHQDIHIVRFSRVNPQRFWIGGDGGLWRTDTSGFNYLNLNANLLLTQFYDIAIDPVDPSRVFGGAQDNSSSARFGSQQWNVTVVTGDGFMNAIDPVTLSRVFQTSYPSGGTPSVYRSTQDGTPGSFSRLGTVGIVAGEPFPWVTPMAALADQVFVASHSVYRGASTQPTTGFTWTKISPMLDPAGRAASVITFHPLPTGWGAYVGTSTNGSGGGRVYRGTDVTGPSPAWTDVTGDYPGGWVSDIAVDPADPDRVYATRGAFNLGRLYRSTTGGVTWSAVGAGLPNVPANAVAVDPGDGRRVFVGTDIGVYESADYGSTFAPFQEGMPLGTVVTDLEIDDSPYVLVAGTYGRGAYRVDLVAIPKPEGSTIGR